MKNLGQHLGQYAKNLFFQSGEPTGKIDRIISIDAFRGLAIALMIVGDNPGNVQRFYPQLRHAEWNGITLVDFAFPLFVFIAGLVVPYAISKRLSRGDSVYQIIGYICSRSIGLFLIGLFLNGFPLYDLSSLRIMGVLQRIAIAYFVAGTITLLVIHWLKNNRLLCLRGLLNYAIALVIILCYFRLYQGNFAPDGNLAQLIDLKYLKSQHMYTPTWDPEGLLGSFATCASALFGSAMGLVLMDERFKRHVKAFGLILVGIIMLEIARSFNSIFPYNKNLWSSSFVLLTAGTGFVAGSLLYLIIDVIRYDFWAKPLVALGSSPFFVYVTSELIRKTLWLIPIIDKETGTSMYLNTWLTTQYITPWAGTQLDSLYFSGIYTVVWMLIMLRADEKRKIIKTLKLL